MMKMLLERIDKKKRLRQGKMKRSLTLFESYKGEKDPEYVKVPSEHKERSDSGDSSSHHMNEFKKHLKATANWGNL